MSNVGQTLRGTHNEHLHGQIVANLSKVREWFRTKRATVDIPFYSSYDIRDSGYKVANVDANIYPAGFNNICPTDRENAPPLVRYYLDRHYGAGIKKLMLITEEHTNNAYYWDNVYTLSEILQGAGLEVCVAIPRLATERATITAASGRQVNVVSAVVRDGEIHCACFEPDLVVSNNDFSEFYEEWGPTLTTKLNPPRELGWWQRKKSTYFKHYNQLSTEFASLVDVDPWTLTVETELFENFSMADEASKHALAERTQKLLDRVRENYARRGIKDDPVAFVKNNAGTYGLAVMRVSSGEDILKLNNRARTKMKAAKGGREGGEVAAPFANRSADKGAAGDARGLDGGLVDRADADAGAEQAGFGHAWGFLSRGWGKCGRRRETRPQGSPTGRISGALVPPVGKLGQLQAPCGNHALDLRVAVWRAFEDHVGGFREVMGGVAEDGCRLLRFEVSGGDRRSRPATVLVHRVCSPWSGKVVRKGAEGRRGWSPAQGRRQGQGREAGRLLHRISASRRWWCEGVSRALRPPLGGRSRCWDLRSDGPFWGQIALSRLPQ